MDLGSFLTDDSLGGGSWADEEVDMTSIGVSASSTAAVPHQETRGEGFGSSSAPFQDDPRRERKEFPIPDEPPYSARISNLSWDLREDAVAHFFETRMQKPGIVTDVKLPTDQNGRLKGFGFVTFQERSDLEEALKLSTSEFSGRRVFVNVAAPQKQDVFDLDWRASRTGPLASRGGRESDVDLDWGAARSEHGPSGFQSRDRGSRRPREEAPDLDWGAARSSQGPLPPRERSNRKPRPEADLDWNSARGEQVNLPPRERRPRKPEADFDWGAARNEEVKLPAKHNRRYVSSKKQEPELDWGSARGSATTQPKSRNVSSRANKDDKSEESQGPQKSSFQVLDIEGENSDDEGDKKQQTEKLSQPDAPKASEQQELEQATSNLSINKEDGWEVVGK